MNRFIDYIGQLLQGLYWPFMSFLSFFMAVCFRTSVTDHWPLPLICASWAESHPDSQAVCSWT